MNDPRLTYQEFRTVVRAYSSLPEEEGRFLPDLRILLIEKLADKNPALSYRLAQLEDRHLKTLRHYIKARLACRTERRKKRCSVHCGSSS
jgi:hypothetical protein